MSLFRKPKKIQRRMFCADDEDEGDLEPPPPPLISHEKEKKENKPLKTTSLLSFADEEEDGEMFKVKKSSQSKRLAKRREKERRRVPDGDSNKYDNNVQEEEKTVTDNDQHQVKKKSKVTLEGLILSGRAALAADGSGDVSGSGSEDGLEEEEHGFHRYRAESVRAALAGAPGIIPDAALIHAARKTRQQARELGGDYVPIKTENAAGSRLVRDDGSGDDDEEEGRLHVRGLDLPSDKPKRGTAAAPTNEELDSEVEEWEEQQMQKAMPAISDIQGEGVAELNPFAVAPPPPRLQGEPHLRPLPALPPLHSAHALLAALTDRLEELEADREQTSLKRQEYRDRLLNAARTRESRAARTGHLDAVYRRAQAARGFLTDLVECLDEKMPTLEALEARALALARRRCEFLVERRRADVRDQADDTLALSARPGAAKPIESEEKRRRCAEREGRRRARRMRREECAANAGAPPSHRDGDSSDDSLPPNELHLHQRETESIRAASAELFADTLPAWCNLQGVCAQLARWRRRSPALYSDAYVADCLPKLLGPYVRHQLILWNPLADEDNEDYEKMDWYKCLMMYGVRRERSSSTSSGSSSEEEEFASEVTEESVRNDPDLLLVPSLICRVLVPKLTELVEVAWDPVCVRACVRLRQLLIRLSGVAGARTALRPLATAARLRLAHALHADVFLPPLLPTVAEGPAGVFWRRCLGAGVRLLRAALALCAPPALLNAEPLVLSLLETLCCAAGAAPGPLAAAAACALSDTIPRSGSLRPPALARIAALATRARARLHSDNPLHLKALEQARGVIAEAKAAE